MIVAHFHVFHRLRHADPARKRIVRIVMLNVLAITVVLAAWMTVYHGHRPPPNIFDSPVDAVTSYLASRDFNGLSTKDRLDYIQGILKRFHSMSQSDSAAAAAFFAGLTGKANEQLTANARTLGKDILVEGAQQYLALK